MEVGGGVSKQALPGNDPQVREIDQSTQLGPGGLPIPGGCSYRMTYSIFFTATAK